MHLHNNYGPLGMTRLVTKQQTGAINNKVGIEPGDEDRRASTAPRGFLSLHLSCIYEPQAATGHAYTICYICVF